MPEITAIVDEIYPFGEYKITDVGKPETMFLRFDKAVEEVVVNKAFVEGRNFEFDHKKKALMELFFTLNKCNRIMAGQYTTPLTPEECEKVVSDREKAYNHLQAIVNPVKPQPREEKQPLMHITAEAIVGLKPYFSAAFKGMGHGNPDRFNENLIPALKMCQTRKEIANLIFACYNSDVMAKAHKPKSWNKWVEAVCRLLSIEGLPYKPGELERPDYGVKYYWLQPPKNRQ